MNKPGPQGSTTEDRSVDDADLFRIVAETASDAIVTIDGENRILFVNPSTERIFGYRAEEMLGRSITMLMPPRLRPFHEAGLSRFINTEDKRITWKGTEITGLHRDGREIPMEISFGATRKNDGYVFTGIIRDISERKLAEENLSKSEERLRMLFDRMTDGFYITTVDGRFVDLNQAMVKMFGYESREEMMSVDIARELYFAPEERISHIPEESGGTADVYRMRRRDGSVIWVEDKGHYIYDQEGNKIFHEGLLRDVTERVLIEEALRENERLVSTLMGNLPGMAYRCRNDQKRTMEFVSDGCLELTGYTRDEIVDGDVNFFTDSIHPDDLRAVLETTPALGEDASFQLTYRLTTKSGKEKWVLEKGRGIAAPGGAAATLEGFIIDVTERVQAEQALLRAEANYRNLVELSPAIVYLADPEPPYSTLYVSPNVAALGYPLSEWYDHAEMWLGLVHPDDREAVLQKTEESRRLGLDTELEYRVFARDGSIRWVHDKGRFVLDEAANRRAWQGVILDITETRKLEEQLQQSQKLESVGRLAGGIAHDFNNMLTAINGYSDLTLRRLDRESPLRLNIEQIKKAGERSASLISQLLAFSRQQILQPQVIDLQEIIPDTASMIERLIGEDIQLVTKFGQGASRIKFDPGKFVQVLMNLAVNGRDAMPDGGTLTIETARIGHDDNVSRRYLPSGAGGLLMIAVSDTGVGISKKAQEQIFEPFYTTKEMGKGTGLGLATVYGIVKQSGGYIVVESELGRGAVFKIYLPAVEGAAPAPARGAPEPLSGTGSLLLVEDEDLVRSVTRQMLESCGYQVREARNGYEALELCAEKDLKIDLVVTDVVMPKMGGRELAEKLRGIRPGVPVLFASGYTDDFAIRDVIRESDANFIQKPFSLEDLSNKITALLGLRVE